MINWVKGLFNKNKHNKWTVINRDNGTKAVFSPPVSQYFNSQLPDADPQDLTDLIKSTKKIIISKRSIKNIELEPYKIDYSFEKLIEIVSLDKIKELGQKLEIEKRQCGHLLDDGSIIFDFTLNNDTTQQIEFLDFSQIRWKDKWKNDPYLKDHVELLKWLYKNDIIEPLNTYNELVKKEEKEIQEYEIKLENWEKIAPKEILKAIEEGYAYKYDKVYLELKKEFPDERYLILNLFRLYGCGLGVWSGFPSYESIPEGILLELSIDSLIEIEDISKLTQEQIHGMARFFSGSDFSKKRKKDKDKIPLKLKNLILDHLLGIGSEDKVNQFKNRVLN
jgi:hypothetical protein